MDKDVDRAPEDKFALTALVSLVALMIIFCAFPSYRYFADSLDYAYNMESSEGWVVHPHHPLVPLVPQFIYEAIRLVGLPVMAIDVLLGWSILAGFLACFGLLLILRYAGLSNATVIAGLCLFAFSRGVWYFSVTPNQHSTGLALNVFVLLTIVIALNKRKEKVSGRQGAIMGVLTGLAAHTTKLNIGMVFPSLYVLLTGNKSQREKIADVARYLGIVILVGGGLLILLGAGFAGLKNIGEFQQWQSSYVTESRWFPNSLFDAIQRNFVGAIELHLAMVFEPYGLLGNWREGLGSGTWLAWIPVKIGQLYFLLWLVVETIRAFVDWVRRTPRLAMQTLGIIAALPAILFSCVYTPEWVNVRILYLPGFMLFIAPYMERRYGLTKPVLRKTWPLVLALICLVGANFAVKVLPESNPGNNPYLNEAIELKEVLGPGGLYITSGTDEGFLRGLYARYSTRCDYMQLPALVSHIREDEESVALDFAARLDDGQAIIMHEDAFSLRDVAFLEGHHGVDIDTERFEEFFNKYAEINAHFVLNSKKFFFVTMQTENGEE